MMEYNLTTPCAQCPFRTDIRPFITAARAREILTNNAEFACHKTVDYDSEGDDGTAGNIVAKSQHCAGVLICLEHEGLPHQMMRICERLGLYKPQDLKMDAPVYRSVAEAIAAHKRATGADSRR